MLSDWIQQAIDSITTLAPPGTFFGLSFQVKGLIAIVLVSLICGGVGALVVGNRMAFFSDALAHCAFAGVALGLLIGLATQAPREGTFDEVGVPLIMVGFGAIVGLAIAFVREKTALASDTVIGVFFAGAMGFGALLLQALSTKGYYNPENFLFGNPVSVSPVDLLVLLTLAAVTAVLLALMYNALLFASFNPSLARSRRVPQRLCNYVFIVLLALIVNLCLKIVGALLINALLIVPAATAANLCRNMRQMFWTTIGLSLLVGVGGDLLSWEVNIRLDFPVGIGGTIVVLSVLLFFVSMAVGPRLRGRQAH